MDESFRSTTDSLACFDNDWRTECQQLSPRHVISVNEPEIGPFVLSPSDDLSVISELSSTGSQALGVFSSKENGEDKMILAELGSLMHFHAKGFEQDQLYRNK